ncbi:MAG TPA: trypsin-like peptidase domain-containing protein [Catenuloplanes sp.]
MGAGPRSALVGIVAVTLATAGAGPALAQDSGGRPTTTPEERAAALARPSVVYLEQHWKGYVFDESGKPFNDGKPYAVTTRCTGFGIAPSGYIATAGHCVDPGMEGVGRSFLLSAVNESIQQKLYTSNDPVKLLAFGQANWRLEGEAKDSPLERQVFMQRGVAAGGKTTGEVVPARVVDFRSLSQGDVALLKVETSDLPAVELAAATDIQIGTRVLSIGYPGSTDEVTDASFEPTNKDGQISAKKTSGSVPVYETSAALSGGMSGGPAVNLDGRVVGVNSFKVNGEEQAFNFLAPSSNLAELLTRNGVKPELGGIDQAFRRGLTDYFAGRYTTAIVSFDKVLALSPTHGQAQEYKTKAAQAREQYGDADQSNGSAFVVVLAVVAGIALLIIAFAVGLFLLLRTRRRRRGAPAQPGGPAVGYPGGAGQPFAGQPAGYLPNTPTMPVNGQAYQSPAATLDAPATTPAAPVSAAPVSAAPDWAAPVSAAPVSVGPASAGPGPAGPDFGADPDERTVSGGPSSAPSLAVGEGPGTGQRPGAEVNGALAAGGSTLRLAQEAPGRHCPTCGAPHPPEARFCQQCGGGLHG